MDKNNCKLEILYKCIKCHMAAYFSGWKKQIYFFRSSDYTVTLALKIGTQPFRMTFQVMMMHNHTKFNKEWLGGSEDNIWANIP